MALKGHYRLIIKQGPVPGKVFEIAKQVVTIGRDVKSDFVVNDAEVSRSHTRLTVQSDGCLVEDLASTNGTFVNGQRLTTAKMIRPGDVLGLGETVLMDFVFVPDPEATLIAPPSRVMPMPAAAPPSARPAPDSRPEMPTSQSAESLSASQTKGNNRILWAVGIGCGVLLVVTVCLVVAVIAVMMAFNIRTF